MLSTMRKHSGSWMIKVLFGILALAFTAWGGYSYHERQANQLARVDDYVISVKEYQKRHDLLLESYRNQFGGSIPEDMTRMLNIKEMALEDLIKGYLINKAATDLGLAATVAEIQQALLAIPAFQKDGRFDQMAYAEILRRNNRTPEEFEQGVALGITARKLEAFVKRRVVVTDQEVLADFNFNHDRIQLDYVVFDPKSFEDQVQIDDKGLETFYAERIDRYKDPEKRRFTMVLFKPEDAVNEVRLKDNDVAQYYEEHKSHYHNEQEVRARHILIAVEGEASEADVAKARTEADKILAEVRKGKDFAELAKTRSQDPGSASKGGDLGFFTRAKMAPEFSDAAFALKPGQIGEPIRSPYGFHIIKVEEVRPEKTVSLDEARDEIEKKLKLQKAKDVAFDKARNFLDVAYAKRDVEQAAQAGNLKAQGAETPISEKDSLPGLENVGPEVMKKLFTFSEKDVSEVIEVKQGFIVAQLLEIVPPKAIPLEKVKARVEKDFRVDRGGVLARSRASKLLEAAKETGNLDSAAKNFKMDVRKSEWFSRKKPDKDLMLLRGAALNAVYQLDESRPFPETPLELGNRFVVCRLVGKKPPEVSVDEERPNIVKRLYRQKEDTVWQAWMEARRKSVKVEKYKEL